jgi:YfiR/HmsC-like
VVRLCAVASAVLQLGLHVSASAQPRTTEYDVKAAFLYNFVKFTEWPASAFRDEKEPIVLGIYGQDPFGPELDRMLEEKTAHGRPFEVRRLRLPADADSCHVVFIANAVADSLTAVALAIGERSVLTVGESPGFALRGGHINFVVENNRVLFEINVEQSTISSLKISSQLLRLARLVPTESAKRGSDG